MRSKRFVAVLGTALALAGCGEKGPPPPVKTVVVEDAAGGYRIAVPDGWVRDDMPTSDPKRRWFASKWQPANVALPVESLFVHLMAPGCPAAEFGNRPFGEALMSEAKPAQLSIGAAAAGTIGNRPAFRMEAKYQSSTLGGEIFEALSYIETAPGSGVLISSRGMASDEPAVRARLDAALAGFEPVPRKLVMGREVTHAGGLTLSVPRGFDEFYGASPFGAVAYAVGPIDVVASQGPTQRMEGRFESISVVVSPPVKSGDAFLQGLIRDASQGQKAGAGKTVKILGQDVNAVLLSSATPTEKYQLAIATFRLGDLNAALYVNAASLPAGRAMDILEAVAATMKYEAVPALVLKPASVGGALPFSTYAPESWTQRVANGALVSMVEQSIPGAAFKEESTPIAARIEVALEQDFRGNGTPRDAAEGLAGMIDRNQARPVSVEDINLPDGRPASCLVVATPASFEFVFFARLTPGCLARVHVWSLPGLSPGAFRAGHDILTATKLVPFEEQPKPAGEILEASRKELPRIIERASKRPEGDLWSVDAAQGKPLGAHHLNVHAGGAWEYRHAQGGDKGSIEDAATGSPGLYRQTSTTRATTKAGPVEVVIETVIDATGADISVSRKRPAGEAQAARVAKPDLFLSPDVASSDAVFAGLAGAPEGTYAFPAMNERMLCLNWIQFTVKGEEDIESGGGTVKARRIEAPGGVTFWVAGGRVIRAAAPLMAGGEKKGEMTRTQTTQEAVKGFFQK